MYSYCSETWQKYAPPLFEPDFRGGAEIHAQCKKRDAMERFHGVPVEPV